MNETTRRQPSEQEVLQTLQEAMRVHREQVDLATLARFSRQLSDELRSYDRKWSHPLGLVIRE